MNEVFLDRSVTGKVRKHARRHEADASGPRPHRVSGAIKPAGGVPLLIVGLDPR